MGSAQAITFGQLLKRYRLAARLSQETLAERSGLAVRSISDLERDVRRLPHPDTIQRLAMALRLSAQDQAALAATARRRGTPSPAPLAENKPASALTPFVGRAGEKVRVARFLAGHEPPVLLFAGEPGIGKSRLLHEAAESARATGWRVLTGGCTRRSGQASYAPLTGALAQAIAHTAPEQQRLDLQGCAWLSRLLPELDQRVLTPSPSWTLPPEQERRLLFAAVRRYLTNVAGPSGILLVLDDLQWASDDAIDLLESLARESADPSGQSLQIVGAYRDTEAQSDSVLTQLITDLARDGLATQHLLGPLDHHEALLLADLVLRALHDMTETQGRASADPMTHPFVDQSALARQVVQRAGGIPFFVVSWANGLQMGGEPGAADSAEAPDRASSDTPQAFSQIPWRVTVSIRQRVAALPLDSQQAISTLALVGRSAPFTLLAAVLGWPEKRLARAVEAACRARLLEETQSEIPYRATYQFPHDLIRETAAHDLSAGWRIVLHRAVGNVLETLDGAASRPEELAYHFAQAGEHARALPYALLAGDRAEAVYAHTEAAGHYRRAREIACDLGDRAREADALEKGGMVALLQGHGDQAFELLDGALLGYQAVNDQEGELRTLAALIEAYLGRDDVEAVARAQTVLTRVESPDALTRTPEILSGLAAVYDGLARLYFTTGRHTDQLNAATRAVELARAAGDERQLVRASFRRYLAEGLLGNDGDRVALAELLALAERTGETWIMAAVYNLLSEEHMFAGEFVEMMAAMEQALEVAERRQDTKRIAWYLGGIAERAYYLGDWTRAHEACARQATIMREVDRHGASWESEVPQLVPALLALVEGREEEGRRLLEQARDYAEKVGANFLLSGVTYALAESDLLAGRAEQAERCLAAFLQNPAVVGRDSRIVQPLVAWAEGVLGREARAETTLTTLLSSAEPLFRVDALRVQGLLAVAQKRWVVAVEALNEALERTRAMPYPYAEAKTLWIYGQLEVAQGDPGAAHKQLKQALAICDLLGERLYRKYIERDLRQAAQKV